MGQRLGPVFFLMMTMNVMIGCDRSSPSPTVAPPSTRPITVASLSPAATEIVIGMGLGDRLVAISNFDPNRDATLNLPRVGDYQTTDWERLASLRPGVMVTQFAADRLPVGLVQKAGEMNIKLVNVPITRLDDIYRAMTTLGDALGEAARGVASREALRSKIESLRAKSTGRKVRALIVVDDAGRGVVGRDNYLNDILEAAGGENVIRPPSAPYPMIDREQLLDLDPEVIFQLLPGASGQVQGAARQMWQSLPQLQAVRNGRVHVFTQTFVLQPSQHVGELAEQFAAAIAETRNATATRPALTQTGVP